VPLSARQFSTLRGGSSLVPRITSPLTIAVMAEANQDNMAEFFDFGGISLPETAPPLESFDNSALADYPSASAEEQFWCATHPEGG
jgi:hypothetical protein